MRFQLLAMPNHRSQSVSRALWLHWALTRIRFVKRLLHFNHSITLCSNDSSLQLLPVHMDIKICAQPALYFC